MTFPNDTQANKDYTMGSNLSSPRKMMEKCPHGAIEWCPKCDEDLRKSSEIELSGLRVLIARVIQVVEEVANADPWPDHMESGQYYLQGRLKTLLPDLRKAVGKEKS